MRVLHLPKIAEHVSESKCRYGLAAAAYGGHRSAPVVSGKLKPTDGVYGIRFAHSTEALVTGLEITKA
jgi:hypothetical protein